MRVKRRFFASPPASLLVSPPTYVNGPYRQGLFVSPEGAPASPLREGLRASPEAVLKVFDQVEQTLHALGLWRLGLVAHLDVGLTGLPQDRLVDVAHNVAVGLRDLLVTGVFRHPLREPYLRPDAGFDAVHLVNVLLDGEDPLGIGEETHGVECHGAWDAVVHVAHVKNAFEGKVQIGHWNIPFSEYIRPRLRPDA